MKTLNLILKLIVVSTFYFYGLVNLNAQQTFTSGTDVNIPDCGTETCSNISVTGVGTINGTYGLQYVTIKINHPYDGDLDIYLVAPDATRIELSTDNGGSGNNYGSGTANNAGPYTVFDMGGAAGNVTGGTAPFQNTYIPEGDLGDANNGQNANGTWQLCVTDDACGDVGFINAWSLTFTNTPASPPGPSHDIGDGDLNACTGDIYDSGGSGSGYSNNESITETYCSDAGDCISITFNDFDTESCCDDLTIYDGPNTGSPVIGTYAGTTLNGVTIESTTGCLTFEWNSDGSSTYSGWDASITCGACPTCSDGIQNGSETGIDCGGTTCPACPCEDITIASLPYSANNVNTSGYGDDFDSGDACGSSYLNGDDIVYEYTPSSNETVDIVLSNTSTSYTGLFLMDGCPDDPSTGCVSYETGTDPSLNCQSLTAGTTYFIVISTWPSPQTVTYDIDIDTVTCNASIQDCIGGTTICSDASFSGNSSGGGVINDLNSTTDGCLSGENQTSWYFFEAQTAGTLEFLISPQNGTDDYDFAMWGPYPSGSTPASICPPSSAPIRCSFAAGAPLAYGGTGLQVGAGDVTEGVGGDDIVDELNINAGEVYILLIDNYSATTSPFDMDITTSGGLTLDCVQLPIELTDFNGYARKDFNLLQWSTSSEINNDIFEIEKSVNGVTFKKTGEVEGAGNSNGVLNYNFKDNNPSNGITYYRLKQVDFDGKFEYSNVIAVKRSEGAEVSIFPNPTKGILKLNFLSNQSNTYHISISNLSKIVSEQTITLDKGNHVMNLESFTELSQGFYIVKVTDKQGNTIKLEKVIKH